MRFSSIGSGMKRAREKIFFTHLSHWYSSRINFAIFLPLVKHSMHSLVLSNELIFSHTFTLKNWKRGNEELLILIQFKSSSKGFVIQYAKAAHHERQAFNLKMHAPAGVIDYTVRFAVMNSKFQLNKLTWLTSVNYRDWNSYHDDGKNKKSFSWFWVPTNLSRALFKMIYVHLFYKTLNESAMAWNTQKHFFQLTNEKA